MTPIEVHKQICSMWKRSDAAGEEWALQYMRVLKPFTGDILAQAWRRWHTSPLHRYAPKPDELAIVCRTVRSDNAGTSKDGMTEQQRRSWKRLQTPFQPERRIYRREEIDGISGDIATLRREENGQGICEAMAKIGEAMLKRHAREVSATAQDR